ncbi:hypothetical protein JCM30471_18370 [Desulfuromonas carbonis]|uniref:PAS domain S-box protein n=1 Tax=Desulfuromonas sp. DDH964 TaxID=1823759 RepID=UPI00078EAD41|nr:PAS domain S-box protein [Desulfuromonas sp. DDH964]AMV73422.1 sensor histidine kinase response regulator, PAS, PAS and PAS domain-containing [Desulfuromonas sp. DDH964]
MPVAPAAGTTPKSKSLRLRALRRHGRRCLLFGLVFSLLCAGFLAWSIHIEKANTLDHARLEALATFNKDQSFRFWATGHGGVYVPVTEETPPNPYLSHLPHRDIDLPDGRRLTLMNPAYIMRQAMSQYQELYGVRGHLTSLDPLNPINAPDPWERQALAAFANGATEVTRVSEIEGQPFLRLMKPMITQQGCLKCHARQGYRVGDIRGGLSVSIPLAPYLAIEREGLTSFSLSFGLIWLLGMALLGGFWLRGRRQVQEWAQAAEREKFLAAIIRASNDAIFAIDLNQTILSWNPGAEKIYGYKAAEVLGQPVSLLLPPASGDEYAALIARIEAGEVIDNYIAERRHKEGRPIWVALTLSPLPDLAGALSGISITSRDITASRAAEMELRKLSTAINQSPVAILITDAQGRIEFVNPRFSEITGYSAAEARGQTPRLLKSGRTPERDYQRLWETITAGQVWQGEFLNRAKDGTLFWDATTIAPVKDAQGAITHYIAIKEEITERKDLERQLQQAQKLEAVGQLAGGVAHDFNNILTAIIGYASLLEMKLEAKHPLRHNASQILAAANRAAELTQSLLAFSRKQVIDLEPIELNAAIRKIEGFLRRVISENIELRTILAPEPLVVRADRGQFEHLLMNLATNARDAMPTGGVISIETRQATLDEAFRHSHGFGEPGAYALISFSDTGIGMDEETQRRIFQPFFTTKEVGKGTGLGLAMVYGTVKQHGGYLNVYSEPGAGTTFNIYLPCTSEEPLAPAHEVLEATLPGGSETILVADDDTLLRSLATEVLTQFGYRVLAATDGEEALELFRSHRQEIDLAILDVVMPKLNGKAVRDEMLRLVPDLRVLFISGYTADIIHRHGVVDPELDFIQKPMRPHDLLRKVREVLDR